MNAPILIPSALPSITRRLFVIFVAMLTITIPGCGQDVEMTEREYLKRASIFEAQGDIQSAIIQYKNAIQKHPLNFQSRWRLGRLYLANKQPQLAEKELDSARNIRPDFLPLILDLSKALLIQGEYDKALSLIDENINDQTTPDTDLLIARGRALNGLYRIDEAKESFSSALALQPGNTEATLGMAEVAISNNEWALADSLSNSILEDLPNNINALIIQADLSRLRSDYKTALSIYSRVISLDPSNIAAHMSRAQVFITRGQTDEALIDIGLIDKFIKKYPVANYLHAQIFFSKGNYDEAQEKLYQVLKVVPDHAPSMLMMASIQYKEESFEAAVSSLNSYLDLRPKNINARKLLADTQIKLNKPYEAINALTPILNNNTQDDEALAILASAYILLGDPVKATAILQSATTKNPKTPITPDTYTTLGLLQAANNEQETAILTLEKALSITPDSIGLNSILALLHLNNNNPELALPFIEQISSLVPNSPLTPYLRGLMALKSDDITLAEQKFHDSIAIQDDYTPAVVALATIEISQGNPNALKKRLVELLKKHGNNIEILTRLAIMSEENHELHQAIDYWDRIRIATPESMQPYISLIDIHLKLNNPEAAVKMALEAKKHHNNEIVNESLGVARLRNNETNVAKEIFLQLLSSHPNNPHYLFRLSQAQMTAGEAIAAEESLTRSLQLNPNSLPALIMMANYRLEQGKIEDSLRIAKKMIEVAPKSPDAMLFIGNIYFQKEDFIKAEKYYQSAFNTHPSRLLMSKLFQTYRRADNKERSYSILNEWIAQHPDDTGALIVLGNTLLIDSKDALATKVFIKALEINPKSAVAHNNLAWTLLESDSARSLIHAETAHQLKPNDPYISDTLGWVLIHARQPDRGLKILEETLKKSPHLRQVRYHLAVAHYRLGDISSAVAELSRAIHEGDFEDLEKAKALLQTLKNRSN